MTSIGATKAAIRKSIGGILNSLDRESIVEQSLRISQNVIEYFAPFHQIESLCIYLSMPNEVATKDILIAALNSNKKVYVPVVTGSNAKDMEMLRVYHYDDIDSFPKTKWNIPEPPFLTSDGKPRENVFDYGVDLIILPGVAFDASCNRLGHGKGYYDSFLKRIRAVNKSFNKEEPTTMGIALNEQIISQVPVSEHDEPLNFVATAERIWQNSS